MVEITRTYEAGVCNIGPQETRARWAVGWAGAVVTAAWALALAGFPIPAPWRWTLFLPATTSAAGFLQAALHFCANFGLRGVFNVDARVGQTQAVRADDRGKDRAQAVRIVVASAAIGAAALGWWLL